VYLGGGALGLGRSYYQKEDEKNTQTLADYSQFADALYSKVDPKTRDLKGPKLLAFEKMIAANLLTIEEQRDAQKRYNPVADKDYKVKVKNMNMTKYLSTMSYKAETVNIRELKYLQNLD